MSVPLNHADAQRFVKLAELLSGHTGEGRIQIDIEASYVRLEMKAYNPDMKKVHEIMGALEKPEEVKP
jgi:hypothetical protein